MRSAIGHPACTSNPVRSLPVVPKKCATGYTCTNGYKTHQTHGKVWLVLRYCCYTINTCWICSLYKACRAAKCHTLQIGEKRTDFSEVFKCLRYHTRGTRAHGPPPLALIIQFALHIAEAYQTLDLLVLNTRCRWSAAKALRRNRPIAFGSGRESFLGKKRSGSARNGK